MANANIERLKFKLAETKASRDRATADISDDERAEIELRDQIEEAEEAEEKARRAKAQLDLDRREEAARDKLGADAKVAAFMIDHYPDTFVIAHVSPAYQAWRESFVKLAMGKKVDLNEAKRKYAVAVVVDWNGIADLDTNTEAGHRLNEYLEREPGLVDQIVDEAARLAGSRKEARKS